MIATNLVNSMVACAKLHEMLLMLLFCFVFCIIVKFFGVFNMVVLITFINMQFSCISFVVMRMLVVMKKMMVFIISMLSMFNVLHMLSLLGLLNSPHMLFHIFVIVIFDLAFFDHMLLLCRDHLTGLMQMLFSVCTVQCFCFSISISIIKVMVLDNGILHIVTMLQVMMVMFLEVDIFSGIMNNSTLVCKLVDIMMMNVVWIFLTFMVMNVVNIINVNSTIFCKCTISRCRILFLSST
mmetsp:Transcript_14801/g.28658  ORF Transcript_14801/g.28658 Transcript_14801/m.28658 type:complete len:238 (-) Transcript_14801:2352-3065(-)